jgi:lysophospholipase L1-like esterase
VFRLLVLGASQTWGAGAGTEEETWVRRLEATLNATKREWERIECVNGGVSGFLAGDVLEMLRKDLAGFGASAALVNLSSNDADTARFRRDLTALARELANRRVPTVFTLEPNSPEGRPSDSDRGDLAAKHAIVRSVAAAHAIPVVDLQAHLAERRDAGLVWWDFVHLTAFGQRLVADKLAGELPGVLPQLSRPVPWPWRTSERP